MRSHGLNTAIILARGVGKRMRQVDPSARLTKEQLCAAQTGMKAMIPIGRPFLDFVLSALADAEINRACLVVGPEHTAIRGYYGSLRATRIAIGFAVQQEPIGTANALLAARDFAEDEPFLALNSDNYYPLAVFKALRDLGEPGLPAFERAALIRESNIPEQRVQDYALLRIDRSGYLQQIVEKPGKLLAQQRGEVFVSMNCWRFDSAIFRACEDVPRSARGEWELPEAVQYGISKFGLRFRAVPFRTGVLDLSRQADVASVAERLNRIEVNL